MKNIVLIGMAGCGKSTVGVLLAKTMGFHFIDTDLIIQKENGMLLQEIINSGGLDTFCIAEERAICSVAETGNCVIATGGSAVYSRTAMLHLKKYGTFYYLSLPVGEVSRRIRNIKNRGIAMRPSDTIEKVYEKRIPMYEEYADITINCGGKSAEDIVGEIADYHRLFRFENDRKG